MVLWHLVRTDFKKKTTSDKNFKNCSLQQFFPHMPTTASLLCKLSHRNYWSITSTDFSSFTALFRVFVSNLFLSYFDLPFVQWLVGYFVSLSFFLILSLWLCVCTHVRRASKKQWLKDVWILFQKVLQISKKTCVSQCLGHYWSCSLCTQCFADLIFG